MTNEHMASEYFKNGEHIRTCFCDVKQYENLYSNDFWELVYVYEGQGIFIADGVSEQIAAGQFLLFSPRYKHSVSPLYPKGGAILRVCNCIFTVEYFDLILKNYRNIDGIKIYSLHRLLSESKPFHVRLTDDRRRNIRHLVWLIAHEYGHYTTGSDAVISSSLLSLFVCISRFYENQINNITEKATDWIIKDITDYIKTNFGYKITLHDLAETVHLSEEYISRYFKQSTGKTISQFLLETRIEKAANKIRTTRLPIGDIAEYCGYSSASNFQKAFRRITGQSPSEYRKTHKIITKQ